MAKGSVEDAENWMFVRDLLFFACCWLNEHGHVRGSLAPRSPLSSPSQPLSARSGLKKELTVPNESALVVSHIGLYGRTLIDPS
jgi:hypothetical protein